MNRIAVTGLGFISSIGNNRLEVTESLRTQRTGIAPHPDFDRPDIPVTLAGTIEGFRFPTENPETWELPPGLEIPRKQLRSMAPHVVFAYVAMQEAIADATLLPDQVSHVRTGMFCASAGSTFLVHRHLERMERLGVLRCPPLGLPASVAGTLNFNLVPIFEILGASGGFVSACSSSAHAVGVAMDLIRLGRQDIMFVVGAEDGDLFSIVPFASCRALTKEKDPSKAPCAFDVKRNGFVGTGGATVLVLENLEHAQRRGAKIYAEAIGWGQSSDGYDVLAPEPNGEGLARAMTAALADAQLAPNEVDYLNAHATSTPAGDRAEMRAIKKVFNGSSPLISTTKSQTGHCLSGAGALEAAITCLALDQQIIPVSLNITELDPEAEGLRIVTAPRKGAPQVAISNSSAFGGSNVVLAFRKPAR